MFGPPFWTSFPLLFGIMLIIWSNDFLGIFDRFMADCYIPVWLPKMEEVSLTGHHTGGFWSGLHVSDGGGLNDTPSQ